MTFPLDGASTIAVWLAATDIGELELTGPAGRLLLRRDLAGAAPPEDRDVRPGAPERGRGEGAPAGLELLRSPAFGLFLRAHPMRDEPFVEPGQRLAAGQVVGLLRIGALLEPVRAGRNAVLAAMLVPDGALVGFGDPIAELAPPPA